MSDTDSKVYMVPENSGTDTASMMAMMNNNNNWMNNPFMYLIWLAFFGNNGFGFGNKNNDSGQVAQLQDTVNTNHNNDLAMQAIQGNATAIHELASNLNVSTQSLTSAVNAIQGAVGMSGKDIVNSVLLGNKDLVQQIASCCCENKQLVTTMGYEGQLRDLTNTAAIQSRIDQLSNGVQEGFASTAYATQAQTNALQSSLLNLTQTIIDKISNLEANAQQDKINTLTALLTAANARAERAAELQPIVAQLNAIKSAQPNTVAVTYPNLTAYPSYLNNMYGGYSTNGFWG